MEFNLNYLGVSDLIEAAGYEQFNDRTSARKKK